VENDEIADELAKVGVDYLQGYGISKPFPLDELSVYVEKLCTA
jgi:EAL domain-containing protein (putative c-di-GMP-specific phosphodiesterase class I)